MVKVGEIEYAVVQLFIFHSQNTYGQPGYLLSFKLQLYFIEQKKKYVGSIIFELGT